MANVTFSSPAMKKDLTVYAVVGDRHSLLALAKKKRDSGTFRVREQIADAELKDIPPLWRFGVSVHRA